MIPCPACGQEFDEKDHRICPFCGQGPVEPAPEIPPSPSDPEMLRDGPAYEKAPGLFDPLAIFATLKAVLLEPGPAFRTMKRDGGLLKPFFYALMLGTVFSFIAGLWSRFFSPAFIPYIEEDVFPFMFSPGLSLIWTFVSDVVIITLVIFVFSLILHGCLHLAGGANRSFETTFRVYAYVSGSTAILTLVPVIGWMISLGWALVCQIIGLREAHETTTSKAAVAVFLPLVFCCGCGAAMVFFFGGLAFLGSLANF